MSLHRHKLLRSTVVVAMLVVLFGAALPGSTRAQGGRGGHVPPRDPAISLPTGPIDLPAGLSGPVHVMIELQGEPTVVAYARSRGQRRQRTDVARTTSAQHTRNEQAQQHVLTALPALKAAVLYRVQNAYNGIAVAVDAARIPQLRRLAGVKAVHRMAPLTIDNTVTVPLIGAPTAWQSPLGNTGENIRIGVIDSGIDYVHTNFGGPGTPTALTDARSAANNPAVVGPPVVPAGFAVESGGAQIYPSARVVGGFDFAGDAYNADLTSPGYSPIPAPDPNPQDCPTSEGGGHGSHVAGTAAGSGVNADGTTYTGAYDASTPFASMRIGPGVAPEADLYALRVFGCNGTTDLVPLAIDWALDPNGDSLFDDRLDVINLSVGSSYGIDDDTSAVAADNAALAGVIVVTAAGNSGDLYYVAGSPGSSTRALTTAASGDTTSIVDAFLHTSTTETDASRPASFSTLYDWPASSPLTAELVYDDIDNPDGCFDFAAGSLTGKIVLVDLSDLGLSFLPCDSSERADHAEAAGAVGIIMASDQEHFDTTIEGNASIPAVFTTFSVGEELKTALQAGTVSITFDNALRNTSTVVVAGADDTVAAFSSRGPRGGDSALKPDITAPGQSIFSTDAGSGSDGTSLNGTSMASSHMAGVMALLREQHPAWSVEELKALAMNTAGNDLYTDLDRTGLMYGPARVGAGRVDVPDAMSSEVIAYNDDGSGSVSVSFGAVEVLGTADLTRVIRVTNKSASEVTYKLAYDPRTTIPGVDYSFPDGPNVVVPAGSSTTFQVRLTADASLMKNTFDETTDQLVLLQWMSEASGLILLTPVSGPVLRVPVYVTARPASAMTTVEPGLPFLGGSGSADLTLTGQGVDTGFDVPLDIVSLVTGFELAGSSPELSGVDLPSPNVRGADLQYVGVTSDAIASIACGCAPDDSSIYFGLASYGDWNTPASDLSFEITIDTDDDGVDDYLLFVTNLTGTDIYMTALTDLAIGFSEPVGLLNDYFSLSYATAVFNNSVMVLPLPAAALDFPAGGTRFDYSVRTSSATWGQIDSAGPFSFDYVAQGLDFTDGYYGVPTWFDLPGEEIVVDYYAAEYAANNSQGALLLHTYNTSGTRAQVLPLGVDQSIDFSPPATKVAGNAPFTVSATSDAGLPVTVSSLTPSVCVINSAKKVTLRTAGDCTLRASQPGNDTFFAATNVDRTIIVIPVCFGREATIYAGGPNTVLDVGANVWTMTGTAGDDVLGGSSAGDIINGNGGDDIICGNGGADVIDGGADNDRLIFDADDTVVLGGLGVDTAHAQGAAGVTLDVGGSGIERVYGTAHSDTFTSSIIPDSASGVLIYAGDGDDSITSSPGPDIIQGNAGADSLDGADGIDRVGFDDDDTVVLGGDGFDTAYGLGAAGVTLDVGGNGFERAYGTALRDTFTSSSIPDSASGVRVYAGDDNDDITGSPGLDILHGDAGADTIQGGAGNDRIIFDDDDTVVQGGSGLDYAYGTGAAGVTLDLGSNGFERAHGTELGDIFTSLIVPDGDTGVRVYGRGGNDSITGSPGLDILRGDADVDSLDGADGNDRVAFDADDTVVLGGTGYDTAYGHGAAGVTLDLGTSGFERAYGTALRDTFTSSIIPDSATGVRIYAGGDNDDITGSPGPDLLLGEAGDDDIKGGNGKDWLTGGTGTDAFSGGGDIDTVLDFTSGDGDTKDGTTE